MSKTNSSHNIKIGLLGIVVTAMAIYFILSQINIELFFDAWANARYIYVVPTLILLLIGLVTRAFRWQVLLNNQLPIHRAFSIMNVAYLVNGVLPLRIGEVARVYLVSRTNSKIPIATATSTIVVERLLDLLAVVILMSLALTSATLPEALRVAGVTWAILAITGFLFLVGVSHQHKRTLNIVTAIENRFSFLKRIKFTSIAEAFLQGLQPLTNARSLALALGWTVISWFFSVVAGYVLMFAFFDTGDWATTALYISAAAFAIALPAVPGNIGTYEASILLALSALGYQTDSVAIAFAVMVHAVNVFVHVSTGFIGVMQEGISLNQLSTEVQRLQNTPPPTKVGS